jgi:hypothetical protein
MFANKQKKIVNTKMLYPINYIFGVRDMIDMIIHIFSLNIIL